MEIKSYSPSEQVDPAVDLEVLPPPLPEILSFRELVEAAPAPPPTPATSSSATAQTPSFPGWTLSAFTTSHWPQMPLWNPHG